MPVVLVVVVALVVAAGCFGWLYRQRIYPGVVVAGQKAGGKSVNEATHDLTVAARDYKDYEKLVIESQSSASASGKMSWSRTSSELGLEYDPIWSVQRAYGWGRGQNLWVSLEQIWQSWWRGFRVELVFGYDNAAWDSLVEQIETEVDNPGAPASVRVLDGPVDGSKIDVFLGENGMVVDEEALINLVRKRWANLETGAVELPFRLEQNVIDEGQGEQAKLRAEKILEQSVVVVVENGVWKDKPWTLSGEELVAFIDPRGGWLGDKIAEYVAGIAEAVNRGPQNALFKFENGRVAEFAPGLDGLAVDEEGSVGKMEEALSGLEGEAGDQVVELVVVVNPPEIATPDVNNLGIVELLGRGESTFYHSIPGRIHNVALTASKLNGVLVPPGEVFSFNQTIGDVSAATGYQSAYIIKEGRTVLGDGGGVCQDSTTLFRAILGAGLPIIERQAHAYRVGYYEQNSEPGYDATVFSPSVDLKFKNDTPANILIQATADTKNLSLVIELYGTSDGRVATTSNYQKWGAVPAPPPLYQDDPTLPPGVVRQVDWAAPGLKTKFDYTVTRGGETIFEKTFYSNYRPWQAVYLKGV